MASQARREKRAVQNSESKYNEVLGWIPEMFEIELFRDGTPGYDFLFTAYDKLWRTNATHWNSKMKQNSVVDIEWFTNQFKPIAREVS
jgi:hypothetical protein